MKQETVLFARIGRVALTTISRPAAMNAIDTQAWKELAEAFAAFRNDPDLWVGVLTGAGDKSSCAGADLKEVATTGLPPSADMVRQYSEKPTIAARNRASEDAREGARAFTGKRAPAWPGR